MAVTISSAVGINGKNLKPDVTTIQNALNGINPINGGASPRLNPDGWIGEKTVTAIRRFQKTNSGLTADGRVDVQGSTLLRMNLILSTQVVTPPQPDPDPKALALSAVPTAILWAKDAIAALEDFGKPTPEALAALNTHFHLNNSPTLPLTLYMINIQGTYKTVLDTLARAGTIFETVSDAQAGADRALDEFLNPYPAYTFWQRRICFSRVFRPWDGSSGFGPFCRAAMVLHEPVHYVDVFADNAHDIYEHSPRYSSITADVAVHNPSSYVCFAQQMFFGIDMRFGAGNPSA